jgi:hypothetical protein
MKMKWMMQWTLQTLVVGARSALGRASTHARLVASRTGCPRRMSNFIISAINARMRWKVGMDTEEKRHWYFTFGGCHFHHNGYVKIYGTYGDAREQMVEWFGTHWAFQYKSAEEAGVDEFNLRQVER